MTHDVMIRSEPQRCPVESVCSCNSNSIGANDDEDDGRLVGHGVVHNEDRGVGMRRISRRRIM